MDDRLPTKEESLACPPGLDADGKKAHKAIMSVMRRYDPDPGGCQTFYTPAQWKERGEDYGTESKLIVVYDGGDVGAFFNYDRDDGYRFTTEMQAALKKAGFYYEECTHWYCAIYPTP
jgi:hypothetical protein